MSGGPSGAEGKGQITEKYHNFVKIGLNPKLWCSFKGGPKACGLNSLSTERDYACLFCMYRMQIDIPVFIKHKLKKKEKS